MRCSYCGCEHPDNVKFCPECGAACGYAQTAQTAQVPPMRPPYPTATEIIKQTGKHRLFLPAAILISIHVAISILSFTFNVISILITIGAWLFYAESRKHSSDPYSMNISSLKVLKITKTVQLVFTWILTVCLGLLLILILLSLDSGVELARSLVDEFGLRSYMSYSEFYSILNLIETYAVLFILIITVTAGIGIAFSFAYSTVLRSYYNSAIESAETGLRPKKLSSAAPILIIISASFTALSSLSYLVINAGLFFSSAAQAVSMIFFAVIIMDAKKRSDSAYYPSDAEVYYNKTAYYQYVNSQQYAQSAQYNPNGYANPYAGGQYQPPQYQPPQYQQAQYQQAQYQQAQYQQPYTPPYQPPQAPNFTDNNNQPQQ